MSDWKEEIARVKLNIYGLHQAIGKYLELTGNPDKIPVEDLETVCQMTEIFAPGVSRDDLLTMLSEFIVYHGFYSVANEDGFFEKLPNKKNQRT